MSSNTPHPKIPFLRTADNEVKSILTKLIPDNTTNAGSRPSSPKIAASQIMFDRISRETAQDVVDANAVFQLLPDVELASQILIGSIISPKDMSSAELNYTVDGYKFNSEVTRALLGVIEDYYKNDYKINERLELILKDVLFMKGAVVTAIIPENSLDFMINGSRRLSLETYDKVLNNIHQGKPMGILGHPRKPRVSLESFRDKEGNTDKVAFGPDKYLSNITISDNFDQLKLPRIRDKRRTVAMSKLLDVRRVSLESTVKGIASRNVGMTPEEIDQLYKHLDTRAEPARVIPNPNLFERDSIGNPLTIELPIESVIPVHIPGDPASHVGYFVLIDQNGRPVQRESGVDYYGELRTTFTSNTKDNSSETLRQVREAMGAGSTNNKLEYEQIQEAYNRIIESDLVARLKNGIYKEDLTVGLTDEIYRIMLYRSFKMKNTQLIYIPAELVVYMAFDFNKHGIGQTLLTKSKILASMRSVLLFAETMSSVRNAVGRKRTSITVDPNDPDPQKTISDIQSAILESSHRGFPLGSPDPSLTLDYLNRAGYDFNINIDSEDYPATKVEFDDYNTEVRAGDSDLQDKLRRMHISGMGLSPEWVDPQQSPEFAVSVITNNLLMQRRVMHYQSLFVGFLTRLVRIYTQHSGSLRQKLKDVLEENKDKIKDSINEGDTHDTIVDEFIESILLTLPSPDNSKIDTHIAAYEQYTTLLEKALEAYITPDLFPADVVNQDSGMVDQTIAVVKAYFQRMWLERNNVLPELDQLTNMGDGEEDSKFSLLDTQSSLFQSVGTAINEYISGIQDAKEKWATKYGIPTEETTDDSFGETPLDEDTSDGVDDLFGEDTEELVDDTTNGDKLDETEEDIVEEEPAEEEELEDKDDKNSDDEPQA